MASRKPQGHLGFAWAVGARAAVVGALVCVAAWLAILHQFYATALILAGAATLVAADLARIAAGADRMLAQFVDGLISEGHERPTAPQAGARHLAAAVDRALNRLARSRAERQRLIDYFQTLTDNVQAAILVTHEDGRIEFANRAARQRLGELGGPLARVRALGPAAAILAAAPLGSRMVTPLADGHRMLASVAGFASPDGTRRRLIALQSVAGDLDAVELGAWQDLVRILSHEMMNSLTPILSLAESMGALIEEGRIDQMREAVDVIARRSASLMNFVERYRRLADLPPAAKTVIRMADFADRIDRLMSGVVAGRALDYASRVEPADLTVHADPDLLEQAVINLLKNAFDAVAGDPAPRVRLICQIQDGEILIAVEDNGPGLSPTAADAAFIPFFTTKADGSGIGLSLARQIALAHQGRIDHAAVAPHGAIFRLALPAASSPQPPKQHR